MKFWQLTFLALVSFFLTFYCDTSILARVNSPAFNGQFPIDFVSPALGPTTEDQRQEADRFFNRGIHHLDLSEFSEAIQPYQKSLQLYKQIDDRPGMAKSLHHLGIAYRNLKDYDQAIKYYQQSGQIFDQIGDRNGLANSFMGLGLVYRTLEEHEKAIESYQQSLQIFEKMGDDQGVLNSLNNLGIVYQNLGKYHQAIQPYQQSLQIFEKMGDRQNMAKSLHSLGIIYGILGEYYKAIESYQQSLQIFEKMGDRNGVAHSLLGLGIVYGNLGDAHKAIEYYQQSLEMFDKISDRNGVANSLLGLGIVYGNLEKYDQAIEYYQQSWQIFKQISDRNGVAKSLLGLGIVYGKLENYDQAIESYQQSLQLFKQIGDRNGIATSLGNLGVVYRSLGKYHKAIESYQQSLQISQEIGDRNRERQILSNIGLLLSTQDQPQLAIVFYKQSVNVTEDIRQGLRRLPTELQQLYLETVADTYRRLADLLLQFDRIIEAQQVLELLKVQELEDYLINVRGDPQNLQMLPDERQAWSQYQALQQEAIAISRELAELEKIPVNQRLPAQQQRLQEIREQQGETRGIFDQFLSSPEVENLIKNISQNQHNINIRNYPNLQKLLANLPEKSVILYPLVLDNRLELLLVTTQTAAPIRQPVNVTAKQLNQAIIDYRTGLKNQDSESFKHTAKVLYDYLIKPFEKDLVNLQVKTLIYAPDRALRYLPLAGLYDGQQWLVEKYRINNITAASLTQFIVTPSKPLSVLAGAFADVDTGYQFQVAQRQFDFYGLKFAYDEINNIAGIIPNTNRLLDRDFNRQQTEGYLGDYNIIHLATHAAFIPGQPMDSFILFGDGDRASINDIRRWDLKNVDLAVLSACQTGLGDLSGNGEEILGLGYIMQEAGAQATVATLWLIEDASTQQLMNVFYQKLSEGNSRAEALRQAQLALINQQVPHPQNQDISAPYHWAGFIIIGNGF
ncbi:MAG: CHAT domain-containing protein [Arthrospira sp. PLM2.Bin9]|nr:tetratricopeptide repeat protein [Arthrospira sp. PLM2.Bin9]TVU54083.1 MAG: CHAT domain-containing protein [Arthrospira sp. PLM2.Bin9]